MLFKRNISCSVTLIERTLIKIWMRSSIRKSDITARNLLFSFYVTALVQSFTSHCNAERETLTGDMTPLKNCILLIFFIIIVIRWQKRLQYIFVYVYMNININAKYVFVPSLNFITHNIILLSLVLTLIYLQFAYNNSLSLFSFNF